MPSFNTAWSHVVIVIQPTSTNWTTKEHNVSIYINGILDVSSTTFYYPKITENYNFQIGRWTINEDSREYDGYLDDFRIYNKALSATEIFNLYNYHTLVIPYSLYTDTTHLLQQLAEEKTGVKGWIWVKHLPASSSTWFYKDDDLQGVNYGTAYDTTSQWYNISK